jgi:hypothetical protein
MDHVFGFDELLRALLGTPRSLTLVGPPGTGARVASRVDGYAWNLIEADAEAHLPSTAPHFFVRELRGDVLHETEVVPGSVRTGSKMASARTGSCGCCRAAT